MSDEQQSPDTPLYNELRKANLRWALFAAHYAISLNRTEAVKKAGYKYTGVNASSVYSQQGAKLLAQPRVRAVVEELLGASAMGSKEVLSRLTEQASFNPGDIIKVDEASGRVSFDWKAAKDAGVLKFIKSVHITPKSVKVDWIDQQKALELLGRHHRLFSDVLTMGNKPDQTAKELTDEELELIARQAVNDSLPVDLTEASSEDTAPREDQP